MFCALWQLVKYQLGKGEIVLKDYPFIWASGENMGSLADYIQRKETDARDCEAPWDATHRDIASQEWRTWRTIPSLETAERLLRLAEARGFLTPEKLELCEATLIARTKAVELAQDAAFAQLYCGFVAAGMDAFCDALNTVGVPAARAYQLRMRYKGLAD